MKIAIAFATYVCILAASPLLAAEHHPNVIVILTDDQGWGDLSVNGNKNLATPNIDRLANAGAQFDRFFVCPVCSPTRAEFLTGRYHPRSGVYSTSAGGERMNLDESTIADSFKAAGYKTAAFGKWHNGMQHPYHPNSRGFDEYYGFCSGHWGNYYSPLLEHNGELCKGDGFVIDDFTQRAVNYIEANRDHPFFVYLAYNTPHSPMQVPDRWWDKFAGKELAMRHREPKKENIGHTQAALAMCENIDWNVGRLMQKLDDLKIADDTIVVYFCDNGPNGNRWNGGMKGRKGSTDEGGVRSPMFVRWNGHINPGSKIGHISSVTDLLPTLTALADIPIVAEKQLDGLSLKPLLLDDRQETDWQDRIIVSHWKDRVSLRTQRFRLSHEGKLFDMESDPKQTKDVSSEHPDAKRRLTEFEKNWRSDVLSGYDNDQRPFVVGHPDSALTQIPARDGKAHGGIQRSNKYPNCSYFRNWKSTDDKIIWDVEVGASGEYDVEIYYACNEVNLGSTIELQAGESTVSAKITTAHGPPEVGANEDRVPRTESYVKEFRPLKLGTLRLEQGWKGELTLRATEIPGNEALEFRLMMLRRN